MKKFCIKISAINCTSFHISRTCKSSAENSNEPVHDLNIRLKKNEHQETAYL